MSDPRNDHTLTPPTAAGAERGGARLELKPGGPRTGFVDGAWWPRSRDLRAELPGLVAALSARLTTSSGPILRVGFARGEWDPTGRQRLVTPTGRIAFGGFDAFESNVVWVSTYDSAFAPLVLAVVPPETSDDRASDTLRRAGSAGNTERAAELLGPQRDRTEAREPVA